MTRPMPGPPPYAHHFDYYPHKHPDDAFGLCPGCAIDDQAVRASGSKSLTDAECAAEYWRAMHNVLRYEDGDPVQVKAIRHADTWHRFANHPHAFEVRYIL